MQRIDNEVGYVLVIVLVFIHIFSMISLHELSRLKDQTIYTRKVWQISVDNILSEYILGAVEKKLANEKNTCMISQRSSAEMKRQDRHWWKKVGCTATINNVSYHYVIERLMHDACARITNMKQTGMTYYRINVLRNQSPSIIQIVTAIAEHREICVEELHHRMQGRQSWREL